MIKWNLYLQILFLQWSESVEQRLTDPTESGMLKLHLLGEIISKLHRIFGIILQR